MTQMKAALERAIRLPTTMERIFNYIKDHPDTTGATLTSVLKLPPGSTSSLLTQLESRKMIKSQQVSLNTKVGAGYGKRMVKHYRTTILAYELLPRPKVSQPQRMAAQAHDTPVPNRIPTQTIMGMPLAEFMDNLTFRDARVLYEALDTVFRGVPKK